MATLISPTANTPGSPQFSLSHCRRFVACVVSAQFEVGIDIEDTERPFAQWGNAEAFLPDGEQKLLDSSPDPATRKARFFLLWTLREAFAKATGHGLAATLECAEFSLEPMTIKLQPKEDGPPTDWHFRSWKPNQECVLTLAIRKGSAPIPEWRLDEVAAMQIT